MTDNEIIEALECCTSKGGCVDCPLYVPEQTGSCVKRVFIGALDLINRQKAEIERYKKEDKEKFNKWELLNERTKERYAELYEEAKSVVRAEAIKEFAERLKRKSYITKPYAFLAPENTKFEMVDVCDIDNIVKEMTEETP